MIPFLDLKSAYTELKPELDAAYAFRGIGIDCGNSGRAVAHQLMELGAEWCERVRAFEFGGTLEAAPLPDGVRPRRRTKEFMTELLVRRMAERAMTAIKSELRYRNPLIEDATTVIAVSQSGETADTLGALREVRDKGALALGVVPLWRIARRTARLRAGSTVILIVAYGLYPVQCQNVLIEGCTVSAASDAGIYVGQSDNVVVRDNVATGNVAGIEIENTVDALVEDNEAWDNTSGLLAFVLPNNPSKVGQNCTMRNNNVHDNNRVNWGDPTAVVSKIPAGIGVAVMAFGALDTIAQVKALEAEQVAYEDELAEATLATFGESLDAKKIEPKLAEVEGQDLTSLVPEKGALDVLAMIVEAATPSDLGQAPPPGAVVPGTDPETGDPLEGEDGGGADGGAGEAAPEAAEKKKVEIVDPSRGIVMSDELTLGTVDIRERKIELKIEANTSTAQDRLNSRLKLNACLTNIGNGKVRGEGRKTFDMTMDNGCYYAVPEDEAGAAEAGAEGQKG